MKIKKEALDTILAFYDGDKQVDKRGNVGYQVKTSSLVEGLPLYVMVIVTPKRRVIVPNVSLTTKKLVEGDEDTTDYYVYEEDKALSGAINKELGESLGSLFSAQYKSKKPQ